MKVMTTLLFAGGLFAALGCKGKQEEPAPANAPANEPAEPGSAAAAPAGSAAPTPSAGSDTVPSGPGASNGTCDVTATGALDFVSHVENEPSAVLTDHWFTAETKAANEKVRAATAARGETYRVTEQPLQIVCRDVPRGLYIRFAPTLSKLADIRPIPQDFPIVQNPEDKPGVMRAEVTMREGGIHPMGGVLHVTRWEQGELAATFTLDIETFDEPPKKAKLAGTFTYHCADNPRCGAK
jgi:hypothetical protein